MTLTMKKNRLQVCADWVLSNHVRVRFDFRTGAGEEVDDTGQKEKPTPGLDRDNWLLTPSQLRRSYP